MPAEWEPHRATWIAWPHNARDWPGKFSPIPWVYAEIVRHLHHGERVGILIREPAEERRVGRILVSVGVDLNQIDFLVCPTDRVWTRDYGPLFVKRESDNGGEVAATNWKFNGWAKYPNWKKDNAAAAKIIKWLQLDSWEPAIVKDGKPHRVVLEGGSIDVNGRGLLLTTEECLLSPVQQRNPGLERHDLEKIFADSLGIRKVLWLQRGIVGDDTHGHIDDLARFVNPHTVVVVKEDDPAEENYLPLQENLELLKTMTDQGGTPLKVVPLPMPRPLLFNGQRLPASYANFYIGNEVVLVPTFNDPNDRAALSTLAKVFPERSVIGIHSVDLVWGLGTLHCLTQQEPRV
ncbi:MAG: agmatine deiminase family protein [Terriglobia bacterium]